jgi:hypothetical protein
LLPWSTLKVVGSKMPHKNKEKNGYKDLQLRSSRPRARPPARPCALRAATSPPNTHTHTHTHYTDGGKVRRWQLREEIRELEENLGNKHEKARKTALHNLGTYYVPNK